MNSELITLEPPSKPVKASVTLPGSKSYSNRALVLAAQAGGTSTLINPSPSDDSIAMVHALQQVGVVAERNEDSWIIETPQTLTPFHGSIDVGPAGTTMRFLTALLATTPGVDITLHGSERMHQRPISDLVEALVKVGASIEYLGKPGCPPLRIKGHGDLNGEDLRIKGSTSSQFVSALLLSSSRFAGKFTLTVEGELTSRSYVDMTLQSLKQFGVQVAEPERGVFVVAEGSRPKETKYEVECDLSGASYLWAMACVSGGEITVRNVNRASAQGDIGFLNLIEQMGATLEYGSRSVTVRGPNRLKAISCDMTLLPDTAQTLAVVAACADGITDITGLGTLRVKETDRLAALVTELAKTGIVSGATQDSIRIKGGDPKFASIDTYDDHRMAMAFAVLGARSPGVAIKNPQVVTKSFPTFWNVLRDVLG